MKKINPKLIAVAVVAAVGGAMLLRNKAQAGEMPLTQAPSQEPTAAPVQAPTGGTVTAPATGTAGKSRGLRNNNPLNIKYYKTNNWEGQTGNDGPFCTFRAMYFGLRAAGRLYRTYATSYGANTIAKIVARWAPASENDTARYINYVAGRAGISASKVLTRNDYPKVAEAMIAFENGEQPLNLADIRSGVLAGFD